MREVVEARQQCEASLIVDKINPHIVLRVVHMIQSGYDETLACNILQREGVVERIAEVSVSENDDRERATGGFDWSVFASYLCCHCPSE
jgi:hypothetical protein